MENILPTELKVEHFNVESVVMVETETDLYTMLTVDSKHKEVITLMVKLYNEYMKNGSGCISVEESKPKFGKVWPSK